MTCVCCHYTKSLFLYYFKRYCEPMMTSKKSERESVKNVLFVCNVIGTGKK